MTLEGEELVSFHSWNPCWNPHIWQT